MRLFGQGRKISSSVTDPATAARCLTATLQLRPTVAHLLAIACEVEVTFYLFHLPKGQSVKYFNRWGFWIKHRFNYFSKKVLLWLLQRPWSPLQKIHIYRAVRQGPHGESILLLSLFYTSHEDHQLGCATNNHRHYSAFFVHPHHLLATAHPQPPRLATLSQASATGTRKASSALLCRAALMRAGAARVYRQGFHVPQGLVKWNGNIQVFPGEELT